MSILIGSLDRRRLERQEALLVELFIKMGHLRIRQSSFSKLDSLHHLQGHASLSLLSYQWDRYLATLSRNYKIRALIII
jgi:hypothetical protein